MNIPNVPNSDILPGMQINEQWRVFFQTLADELTVRATSLQQLSTSQIANLTPIQKQGFFYDYDLDKFYVALSGTLRQIAII